jgi:long-chain acyl-CoA synthetase
MDVSALVKVQPAALTAFERAESHPNTIRFQVRNPDATWRSVSWRSFASQIANVASYLTSVGFQRGSVACVYGANSVEWAVAALAINAVGGVMVPIYPASTADQVSYIANHADASVMFVGGADLHARASSLPAHIRIIGLDDSVPGIVAWSSVIQDAAQAADWKPSLRTCNHDDICLMLYTSGTSGPPKAVPLSHNNVGSNAADWLRNHESLLAEGDRDVLWLPMSHIFGYGELCLGNTLGWCSYMVAPADALAVLPEVKPHIFMSVPAYWEKIARATHVATNEHNTTAAAFASVTGGCLRFGLSGGAGLQVDIKNSLRAAGLVVIEGYGLTETSPTLTLNHPTSYRFDSVGKPLPSVSIRLADDGEILAKGPNVFRGYFKDPVATEAAFTADGWFCTGDIGQWTDDGFLQIIDRKKDILVTAGGKNVPPVNIENHFVGDSLIDRVVVYGDGKPYLTAAVWLLTSSDQQQATLHVEQRIAAVNAQLAKYETIKRFWLATEPLTVEDGLLTSSLKLRRKAVYARYKTQFEALYT